MAAATVEEYIQSYPEDIREKLNEIRHQLLLNFPDAVEDMVYGVPTVKVGKKMVHYAAFKNHIGFYPTPAAINAFSDELTDYSTSRGTIRFPLKEPVPIQLIIQISKYRMNEL